MNERQERNVIDLLAACLICSIVYVICRGRVRPMTPYEEGYLQGSMRSLKITGEVIKDYRERGII